MKRLLVNFSRYGHPHCDMSNNISILAFSSECLQNADNVKSCPTSSSNVLLLLVGVHRSIGHDSKLASFMPQKMTRGQFSTWCKKVLGLYYRNTFAHKHKIVFYNKLTETTFSHLKYWRYLGYNDSSIDECLFYVQGNHLAVIQINISLLFNHYLLFIAFVYDLHAWEMFKQTFLVQKLLIRAMEFCSELFNVIFVRDWFTCKNNVHRRDD